MARRMPKMSNGKPFARVIVDRNNIDRVSRYTSAHLNDILNRAGKHAEGRAKQVVIEVDAILTGDMYRGIGYTLTGKGTNKPAVELVSIMPYSVYVHEGTEHMRPRPFLTMAIEDTKPHINRMLSDYFKDFR